jgi:hypothetical protein
VKHTGPISVYVYRLRVSSTVGSFSMATYVREISVCLWLSNYSFRNLILMEDILKAPYHGGEPWEEEDEE